jgi:RNA-binding protein
MALNKRQISYLRGKAHTLHQTVTIGSSGLTDAVLAEIKSTLSRHELIKIKIASDNREIRNTIANTVCRQTGAENVQRIGKILIIFRPGEKKRITLPD